MIFSATYGPSVIPILHQINFILGNINQILKYFLWFSKLIFESNLNKKSKNLDSNVKTIKRTMEDFRFNPNCNPDRNPYLYWSGATHVTRDPENREFSDTIEGMSIYRSSLILFDLDFGFCFGKMKISQRLSAGVLLMGNDWLSPVVRRDVVRPLQEWRLSDSMVKVFRGHLL